MSEFQVQNSPADRKKEIDNFSGNNNLHQKTKKIIRQKQIINTTTKKILISKKENNFQKSPQKIIHSNRIYNRQMVSPQYRKVIPKPQNKIIYHNEEVKEKKKNINSNDNNANMNTYKNNTNNIIYNQEDFNNNNYYENEYSEKNKEKKCMKKNTTLSYDLIENKNLFKNNYNYISPKKDSKVFLKKVICSPISVHYTEIKDAELKINKEYKEHIEEIEETEISIKNKIINIWDRVNEEVTECNFSLMAEEDSRNKIIIESYEKKIEELNEIISNLYKEREQMKNGEFPDNKIQSFNFQLKTKNFMPKPKTFAIKNIDKILLYSKPEYQNKVQNVHSPYGISEDQKNIFLNTEEIQIKSGSKNNILKKNSEISEKLNYELEQINAIYIPGQKKEKFSCDKIYGQELCILAKKKKKIFKINHKDSIQLFQNKEKVPLNKMQKRDKILLSGKKLEKNEIQKEVCLIEIYPIQSKFEYEEINNFFIPRQIKPENIIEYNDQFIIESTKKINEFNIEYIESIFFEEILEHIFEIERNQELELLKEKKLYLNTALDIVIGEDIFYDEISKPDNEIQELERFSLLNKKTLVNAFIEKVGEIEIIPDKKIFADFFIENNGWFMIENTKANIEEFEYSEEYKKSQYFNKKKNINYYIPENYSIEDTANFQIISLNVRELYQQKLQGFSIIRREKEINEINTNNYYSINNDNYCYDNRNISNNTYYNRNKLDTNRHIKRKRIVYKNNIQNDYIDENIKYVNTIRSQNYKRFIAIPKSKIECISSDDIFNENKFRNENCYSENESLKGENLLSNNKNNKDNIVNNNNLNKINERYNSKISLKNNENNSLNENDNNILNKSLANTHNNYFYSLTNNEYHKSIPIKINDDQYKDKYKTLTERRIFRRKIYRFEEGKN